MNKPAPLQGGGRIVAITPQTFEDVQRIARAFVGAGIGSYKWDATEEQKLAQATTQIMAGLELGIPPTQAMGGLMVVNGRVTAYGEMVTGLLWAAGFKVDMGCRETEHGTEGFCTITRPDGTEISATFTEAEAKQSGLWDDRATVQKKGKGGSTYSAQNDSPWYRFRPDMMAWKAAGRASRRGASDVLRGLWIREDLYQPAEMRDVTPVMAELPDPDIDQTPLPDPEEVNVRAIDEADVVDDLPDPETETPIESDPHEETLFIDSIRDDIVCADGDHGIIDEIIDHHKPSVAKLSPAGRKLVAAIYADAKGLEAVT